MRHGDLLFSLAAWLSRMIWRAAGLMVTLLKAVAPGSFRDSWVAENLRDYRKGYSEVLKVLTRFAAVPVLLLLGSIAFAMRAPLQAFVKGIMAG